MHYAIFFAQNVNTVAIAGLKQEIDKVRRELYGSRSERKARLLEQMELQLEELEADAGARLFFLPQYSPDLNPIEKLFAKIKHRL
uniref:transposase n=1 Tax=Rhizobium redzepovicii TaxID=2867518 RepID=UPI0035C739FE